MTKTLVKTPCVVCAKPIGAAMIRHYPYATVCGSRCFVQDALGCKSCGRPEHTPATRMAGCQTTPVDMDNVYRQMRA